MPFNSPFKDYHAKHHTAPPPKYIPPINCLPPSKALIAATTSFTARGISNSDSDSTGLKELDLAFDKNIPPLIDVYNGLLPAPAKRIFNEDTAEKQKDRQLREVLGQIMSLHSHILFRTGYREQYPTSKTEPLKELSRKLGELINLLEGKGLGQQQTIGLEAMCKKLREEVKVREFGDLNK
jgi:hypothetical protein